MMLLKKTVYDKLVAKVDNIDTSDFALKTKYNTDKTELEKKNLDVSNLVKKTKQILALVPVHLSELSDIVKNDVVKKNCVR